MADPKLDYFKKKVIAILKQKEGEEPVTPEVKKSLDAMDYVYGLANPETMGSIEKAYGVGTVRIWKGKKYKKVSQNPTKWVRIYDKVDRGAKSSITRLINKADSCQSIDQLLQFCMSNHALFKDANGVDLPILDELRKFVDEKKKRLENGDTSSIKPQKKTPAKKEVKKEDNSAEYKEVSDVSKMSDDELSKVENELNNLYEKQAEENRKLYDEFNYSGQGADHPSWKKWIDGSDKIKKIKADYWKVHDEITKRKNNPKQKTEEKKTYSDKEIQEVTDRIDSIMYTRIGVFGLSETTKALYGDNSAEFENKIAKFDAEAFSKLNAVAKQTNKSVTDYLKESLIKAADDFSKKYINEKYQNSTRSEVLTTIRDTEEVLKLAKKDNDDANIIKYTSQLKALNELNEKLYTEESEAEKHQNRSDAMKGNQNAYKGGPKEEPKEPETPKADDLEETKKQMKKVEDLFETYISGYNHGVGYWLRNKGNADAHHKAFCRATGIPYLVQAKAALENEGYTMPEIPQKLLDKFEEYKKAREGVSGWSTAGESILSGIRQSEFDAIVEAFKKPLQDKYKELKDKLPKVEDGTPKNNPPVAGKTNEEHAELFDAVRNDEGDMVLTYNGKPYSKITGWGGLAKQKEMVQAAGMDPEAQIEYTKNKYNWNTYWTGIDSSLRKYGEKKIKELASTPVTSDEEFYSKLADACKEKYRDYGYIHNAIENHEYNKKIVEKAKKIAAKYDNNNSAIGDVDLPVDPKDRDEAISIIGDDVSYILGSGQWSNTTKATLKDKIIRRVRNKPGVARAMLVYIKEEQARTGKTVFTPKNEIWDYLPKLNENAMNALMSGTEETDKSTSGNLYTGDGISSVVEDKEAGRYQVYFTGKPDYDTRTILKQNGFRWTPSIGAWQCYNTSHGQRSLERVAEELGWNKE